MMQKLMDFCYRLVLAELMSDLNLQFLAPFTKWLMRGLWRFALGSWEASCGGGQGAEEQDGHDQHTGASPQSPREGCQPGVPGPRPGA